MNTSNKPHIIKDYNKLSLELLEQIKLAYPRGFHKHLITFTDAKKHIVSALPFEGEDIYYLVKMSQQEAKDIISQDSDYNDLGVLKSDIKDFYEEKYDDEFEIEELDPSEIDMDTEDSD